MDMAMGAISDSASIKSGWMWQDLLCGYGNKWVCPYMLWSCGYKVD